MPDLGKVISIVPDPVKIISIVPDNVIAISLVSEKYWHRIFSRKVIGVWQLVVLIAPPDQPPVEATIALHSSTCLLVNHNRFRPSNLACALQSAE